MAADCSASPGPWDPIEIIACINALQFDINNNLVPAADDWVEEWVGAWTTYTTKLQNKRSAHIVIPVLMDKVICDLGEIVLPTIGKYSRHPLANAFLVAGEKLCKMQLFRLIF